ncbi:outer membrane lipoprotein carrier protein LolA [Mesorhizobium australicum]|uniref:Outer membrane lipoprotein-sorting protein n=1 Tax=Mesorhizobium australicum TaxID=536018 RepID=A0A1X7Q0C0_9HYPH|nr:outer membrane lipoprotein carrier protein LolA [Mesorhizobium australicum]SMH57792.1 Outer membrane lipoprotein-sorting protein [Mesorhizobium australicum]
MNTAPNQALALAQRAARQVVRLGAVLSIAGLVAGLAGTVHAPMAPVANAYAASEAAQKIADHFSGIKTMAGEFVQFGPRGEKTGGKFFIQRPGKIRFNYEAPSAYRVVADGKSVVISNTKLKTADLYPLSKTPLKLLLDERIDLSGSRVQKVTEDPDLTTIVLADKSVFGNSRITMMFDPKSSDLRQWTITDAQGKDTTVMIFNVQSGIKLDPKFFEIDYRDVSDKNQAMGQR